MWNRLVWEQCSCAHIPVQDMEILVAGGLTCHRSFTHRHYYSTSYQPQLRMGEINKSVIVSHIHPDFTKFHPSIQQVLNKLPLFSDAAILKLQIIYFSERSASSHKPQACVYWLGREQTRPRADHTLRAYHQTYDCKNIQFIHFS